MKTINLIEHPNWAYQQFRVRHQFLDLNAVHTYMSGPENAVGVRPDNGQVQFKVLRNCVESQLEDQALEACRKFYDPGSAAKREGASGFVKDPDASSVVVGFMERHRHQPYARATAPTLADLDSYRQMLPYAQALDGFYREDEDCEIARKVQEEAVAKTKPNWILPGTAFTTITINQDWQTACHPDQGNLQGAFSAMTCMASNLGGGELIWPRWGVAIQFGFGDIILGNFHELHCTAPFVGGPGKSERITCVFYFRDKMTLCGTAEEELERVKMM